MRNRLLRMTALLFTLVLSGSSQTFATLATFTGGNGANPFANLTQGTDGNLYGMTSRGGALGYGVVFSVNTNGTIQTLHSFDGSDGSPAFGSLIEGTDLNFYGLTPGPPSFGSVFRVSPNGSFTTLHKFNLTDGAYPDSLIQARDGTFYGTTTYISSDSSQALAVGSAFRMAPDGTVTTLHVFTTAEGTTPISLIQAADGDFYGATDAGSVFRMNSAGAVTVLASIGFAGSPLIQGADGNFYGTAVQAGLYSNYIYKLTPQGVLSRFASLGSLSRAALLQASDGNFYGTAGGYATSNSVISTGPGTLFEVTPDGTVSTLHQFESLCPCAGLIQGSDGLLYGADPGPGPTGYGSIYKLALPLSSPTIKNGGIGPIFSTLAVIAPGSWISIYGTNLASGVMSWNGDFPISLLGTSVTIDGKSGYLCYVSPGQINLQAPDDTAIGLVSVVVKTPAGSIATFVTMGRFTPSLSLLDEKHPAAIILRTDGSGAYGGGSYDIVGPTGTSLGYKTVAAKAGDTLSFYGVGFGPTSPVVPSGMPFAGFAATTNAVQLLINGITVTPSSSGLSSAGLYQFNITLPAGLGTGDVPLQATVAGTSSPIGVMLSLQ